MAKSKKEIKEKPIEVTLWEAANKLRGSVEPAEYKHVVLGLIFLKFASDKFEEHRAKLIADGKEKYIEMPEFYNMNNVFFLEETSRWSFLIKKSKQNDIALLIDTALHTIEKNNKALKGALPDNYFSRLGLDVTKLASLLDTINDIDTTKDPKQDVVGKVYEYFLSKFALAEGKGKGEFYTPKSIVNLIAEMIEPYKGIIYDPACGSGGMFVQSIKFIEAHHGNKKEISIYGQEYTNTTYKLAKMNLAIRGISGNLGEKAADTFADDQHKDLKADYIMANPPFNQKDWRAENELTDDPRWRGYNVPPKSNANYAWILNMVSKLSENGVAGFILANGALSGGGEEYKIRRKLIENNLVEAILVLPRNLFYTTDISVTLWIVNKNKKAQSKKVGEEIRNYRDREKEILFMDLRQMGEPFEKKYTQFSDADIQKVVGTYHQWQTSGYAPGYDEAPASSSKTPASSDIGKAGALLNPALLNPDLLNPAYQDIPEYCYSASFDEVAKKDFSLVPSKYIEFVNRDENIDFDEKMKALQSEFAELLKAEAKSTTELLTVFKDLGYEIKL
ncbi:MAG: type I restriction-modification system subunit M [Chitinophagales bacterium]|nr:type I restriction-modification system subunit M [Chitinophagales bacterium]